MVRIRRVEKEDIAEVKQLLSETWAATYNIPAEIIGKLHDQEILELQTQNPDILFVVAADDSGRIVGVATAKISGDDAIGIERLYVHPHFQRQGIGRELLRSIIRTFPGVKTIRLEVARNNPKGISFYLKHGFVKVAERQRMIEGVVVDIVVMENRIHRIG